MAQQQFRLVLCLRRLLCLVGCRLVLRLCPVRPAVRRVPRHLPGHIDVAGVRRVTGQCGRGSARGGTAPAPARVLIDPVGLLRYLRVVLHVVEPGGRPHLVLGPGLEVRLLRLLLLLLLPSRVLLAGVRREQDWLERVQVLSRLLFRRKATRTGRRSTPRWTLTGKCLSGPSWLSSAAFTDWRSRQGRLRFAARPLLQLTMACRRISLRRTLCRCLHS